MCMNQINNNSFVYCKQIIIIRHIPSSVTMWCRLHVNIASQNTPFVDKILLI